MQTETLSLRFITVAIALAGTLWIAANGGIFMALYGDTLTPLTIPYVETFTDQQRVDYRRVFGLWRIQDQTLVQSDTNLADVFAVIPIERLPNLPIWRAYAGTRRAKWGWPVV